MKRTLIVLVGLFIISTAAIHAQDRKPVTAASKYVVKTKQQVDEITAILNKKPGNTAEDIVAASGQQTRVAIFHDEKRENDLNEAHDLSDDVYYVTNGVATLLLGGTLVDPNEISPGEWRAKTTTGGEKVVIKKGDLIFVPRGTPHQRTATDKKFSMILIKIFAQNQPAK